MRFRIPALAVALLLFAGCMSGFDEPVPDAAADAGIEEPGDESGQPPASPADNTPPEPDNEDPVPAVDCLPAQTATSDGNHRVGDSCTQGCHDGGALSGPSFTLAGTVFGPATSNVPRAGRPGINVHLIDATGREVRLVSAANGNFYTAQPLVFPVRTFISACPDSAVMVAQVEEAESSCNAGGCHDAGRRIALPGDLP